MRVVVFSDVHANMEALTAVFKDIETLTPAPDKIVFLGDAVGYGPQPNETLELIRSKADTMIAGNHDHAAIGLTDTTYFNNYAKAAIEWTEAVLSIENAEFIRTIPLTESVDDMLFVHATPYMPGDWNYIMGELDAEVNFQSFSERFCFIGHSHRPIIMEKPLLGTLVSYQGEADLKDGCRYIINIGSVGQPRDRDPRSCYAVFDDDRVTLRRVAYDIKGVQKKMFEVHLPTILIERLTSGT